MVMYAQHEALLPHALGDCAAHRSLASGFELTVTKVQTSNGTLTVTRHVGGTSATAHDAGDDVMSTPLPLLNGYSFTQAQTQVGYANGRQAQMCIVTGDTASTTVIDIGDGWIAPK